MIPNWTAYGMDSMKKNFRGFTLIELSIVLVIIGLIVAGIVSAQKLIAEAQLQRIVSQANQYITAINTFKLEYDAFPGDITNAYDYWSASCGSSADECNGNGNNRIDYADDWPDGSEEPRGWQHLQLANIIPGSLTGGSCNTGRAHGIGVNTPAGPRGGGWKYRSSGMFGMNPNSFIALSLHAPDSTCGDMDDPIITIAEMFAIDTKYDDGIYNTGKIFGYSQAAATCRATYDPSTTGVACIPTFFVNKKQ